SPERIGTVLATGLMLSGVLGPVLGGLLADLCQRTRGPRWTSSMLAGLALVTVPAAAFGTLPGPNSASCLLVVFMTLVTAVAVMGTGLFAVVIPNQVRGLCMAISAGVPALMLGLAPLIVSLVANTMGGPAMIGDALARVGMASGVLGAVGFTLA